jgi:hypothetical protein
LLSSETLEQENRVIASKHPDNLPSDKRLSETAVFFLMFSKLSHLNVWLVYPSFSYKHYGTQALNVNTQTLTVEPLLSMLL